MPFWLTPVTVLVVYKRLVKPLFGDDIETQGYATIPGSDITYMGDFFLHDVNHYIRLGARISTNTIVAWVLDCSTGDVVLYEDTGVAVADAQHLVGADQSGLPVSGHVLSGSGSRLDGYKSECLQPLPQWQQSNVVGN